jgi:hypothetical protein
MTENSDTELQAIQKLISALEPLDIVLANRQSLLPLTNQLVLQSSQESKRER